MTVAPDGPGPSFDPLAAVRIERLELCDFLDTLDEAAWRTPSLCDGWTIHDVVTHLTTSTRTGLRQMIVGMIRARFDFDRMESERARRLAEKHGPAELVEMLRSTAGSAAHAPGASHVDQLVDVIVHGHDVSRPLGVRRTTRPTHAVAAVEHVVASRWYGARSRLAGVELVATDADWRSSERGTEVRAPLDDLLLLATGRPDGLDAAAGDGVAILAPRLPRPPATER